MPAGPSLSGRYGPASGQRPSSPRRRPATVRGSGPPPCRKGAAGRQARRAGSRPALPLPAAAGRPVWRPALRPGRSPSVTGSAKRQAAASGGECRRPSTFSRWRWAGRLQPAVAFEPVVDFWWQAGDRMACLGLPQGPYQRSAARARARLRRARGKRGRKNCRERCRRRQECALSLCASYFLGPVAPGPVHAPSPAQPS
jgi:hypothetical protein